MMARQERHIGTVIDASAAVCAELADIKGGEEGIFIEQRES